MFPMVVDERVYVHHRQWVLTILYQLLRVDPRSHTLCREGCMGREAYCLSLQVPH